jgi:hypothetical protein
MKKKRRLFLILLSVSAVLGFGGLELNNRGLNGLPVAMIGTVTALTTTIVFTYVPRAERRAMKRDTKSKKPIRLRWFHWILIAIFLVLALLNQFVALPNVVLYIAGGVLLVMVAYNVPFLRKQIKELLPVLGSLLKPDGFEKKYWDSETGRPKNAPMITVVQPDDSQEDSRLRYRDTNSRKWIPVVIVAIAGLLLIVHLLNFSVKDWQEQNSQFSVDMQEFLDSILSGNFDQAGKFGGKLLQYLFGNIKPFLFLALLVLAVIIASSLSRKIYQKTRVYRSKKDDWL